MNIFRTRPAAALAMAAALSLTATPAFARGGWGHRHHHGDGIDGGDVLAGLLVIGGIAAIASAAGKKDQESREADYRYPNRDYRSQDDGYYVPPADGPDRPGDRYGAGAGDINGAVDDCVAEIERNDRRVDSVDSVNREGDGWRVQGRAGGRDFSCTVDRDGRVRASRLDGRPLS